MVAGKAHVRVTKEQSGQAKRTQRLMMAISQQSITAASIQALFGRPICARAGERTGTRAVGWGDGSCALWEATDIMDVMTQHQDSSEPHNSHRDGWRHGARCPNSVFVPSSLQMAILPCLGRSFTLPLEERFNGECVWFYYAKMFTS